METYYFTFGQNHWHRDGIPLKDYWVRVVAEDYGKARMLFIERFSSIYMEAPDKWSMQYKEKDFKSSYFPNGEFTKIF